MHLSTIGSKNNQTIFKMVVMLINKIVCGDEKLGVNKRLQVNRRYYTIDS